MAIDPVADDQVVVFAQAGESDAAPVGKDLVVPDRTITGRVNVNRGRGVRVDLAILNAPVVRPSNRDPRTVVVETTIQDLVVVGAGISPNAAVSVTVRFNPPEGVVVGALIPGVGPTEAVGEDAVGHNVVGRCLNEDGFRGMGRDQHVADPAVVGLVEVKAPGTVADRKPGDVHTIGRDVEHVPDAVAVDDGRGPVLPLQGQGLVDRHVLGIGPRPHVDGVTRAGRVHRLLDSGVVVGDDDGGRLGRRWGDERSHQGHDQAQDEGEVEPGPAFHFKILCVLGVLCGFLTKAMIRHLHRSCLTEADRAATPGGTPLPVGAAPRRSRFPSA